MTDDELDRELRDLFHSDRLDVPVAPNAVRSVVSGARRRQVRRRALAATGGAAAVAMVVLGGVVVAGGLGQPSTTEVAQPGLTISASHPSFPGTTASTTLPADTGESSSSIPDSTSARPDTTTHPTQTTTPSATTTSQPAPPASWPKLIGPAGYGLLSLGMTEAQALATGYLAAKDRHNGGNYTCPYYEHFNGLTGYADATFGSTGLVQIAPPDSVGVQTPEGVGVGSTLDQLKSAYPLLSGSDSQYQTPVPGGSGNAQYYFELTEANVVHEVLLEQPGC